MLNIGEYPKDVEESTLLSILEVDVPKKYYLSETACRGVLRRAVKSGTVLHPILLTALMEQGNISTEELIEMGLTPPPPTVISLNNHPSDSRITIEENGKCQTLTSRMGTGGGNTPLLLVGIDPYNHCLTGDKAATLGVNCGLATGRNGVILVMNDQGGNRMKVEDKDISPTLRAETHGHPPIVALNLLQDPISSENKTPCITTGNTKAGQANLAVCYQNTIGALCARDFKGVGKQYVGENKLVVEAVGINGEKSGTLDASYYKGCGQRNGVEREIIAVPEQRKWIVRRLTPTECARLQGMPDWWCKDVKHSDSAEYKMWGNGMALPTLMYVTEGIALVLRKEKFRKILQGKDK